MDGVWGKVFRTAGGDEFGNLRAFQGAGPADVPGPVIAEDECGNYFFLRGEAVCFWDHETLNTTFLASNLREFLAGCVESSPVELKPGQVLSAWIDPEFARQWGARPIQNP